MYASYGGDFREHSAINYHFSIDREGKYRSYKKKDKTIVCNEFCTYIFLCTQGKKKKEMQTITAEKIYKERTILCLRPI